MVPLHWQPRRRVLHQLLNAHVPVDDAFADAVEPRAVKILVGCERVVLLKYTHSLRGLTSTAYGPTALAKASTGALPTA